MELVIVESPTKAKTISRFLGKAYRVKSSFGHVRDLPPKKIGIDIKKDFTPKYEILPKSKKYVKELKETAEKAKSVILATDEDREGEAIAWHLLHALKLKEKDAKRIVFHEITKRAIDEALAHPRPLDLHLVDAQQARRVLDRLVGYKLSPFLWRKVMRGLSAGRVQSVAVRLVVDREHEIRNFTSQEYWTIEGIFHAPHSPNHPFPARLFSHKGTPYEKLAIASQDQAQAIIKDLANASYKVAKIEKKTVQKHPFAPFTTSTLQQDAWRKLRFSAKQTMRYAQQLYEGVELGGEGSVGLITYMRTDSLNLSLEATAAARTLIEKEFGPSYLPPAVRRYKTKSKGAQEAHEAIRPTDPARTPERVKPFLDAAQHKLYSLIWRRFIACQMQAALFDATSIDISAGEYIFRATGQVQKFDGFLRVYEVRTEDILLPELKEGEAVTLEQLEPKQHFTQPPPRYTEASLVKALEEHGIGRPSTYAPIMSTVQERGYITKNEEKRLVPTETAELVTKLLVEHFPQIVDIQFTAHMEEDLDEIAQGKTDWVPVVRSFYEPFERTLKEKYETVNKKDVAPDTPTDQKCPTCGRPLVIKRSRFGKFYGCSGYPECTFTKPMVTSTGVKCPQCATGELVEKKTRRGALFYGCSTYPECDFALWDKPTGEYCPVCKSLLVIGKQGETRCSNKQCPTNTAPETNPKFQAPNSRQ